MPRHGIGMVHVVMILPTCQHKVTMSVNSIAKLKWCLMLFRPCMDRIEITTCVLSVESDLWHFGWLVPDEWVGGDVQHAGDGLADRVDAVI